MIGKSLYDIIINENTSSQKGVAWYCKVGGEWIIYPSEVGKKLEDSYLQKRRLKFSLDNKEYEIDFSASVLRQVNTKTKYRRKVRRQNGNDVKSTPSFWEEHPVGSNFAAITISETSAELKCMEKQTIISFELLFCIKKIVRIQNVSLWEYFTFRKERMTKLSGGKEPNIVSVWHGTRDLDPMIICKDVQDGFMMQYSQRGTWGRGIYFAECAEYSNRYAYINNDGSRTMILAELLSGEEIELRPDKNLIHCPPKPAGNMRYDTVTGKSNGSKVYTVYENGRAYPKYLVTYKPRFCTSSMNWF
mmetsp:Transcript_18058/g.25790  ORF Transcript_18058/g.25790 Transcript_18058/m.25790 type:complete len:303 (+) Transcript_18058:227-1135(+)